MRGKRFSGWASCPDSGDVADQGDIENPTVDPTVVCSSCRRFRDSGGRFMDMFLADKGTLYATRLVTVN